ncbi:MAG: zinc-binding alcohol dehydrogenase [Desulfobulbaceae bacterium]|jgi:2-desacetyl-2-hydroxyethyl bacteriochlorophyllide A dehydrogenase|nr:zinc-binding alcohol dehydrogenase [Desulfobulbaceae bacterium]
MRQHRLEFVEPGRVAVLAGPAPHPTAEQVLVETRLSAISPGTEMLIYRGQWPSEVTVDATLNALAGTFAYPLAYGYCTVGRVIATGSAVPGDWLGRRVFAFHPHESLFCALPSTLHPIPDDLDDATALFLPNMETAVNLLLDGAPLIGEKVVVIGQGIVGLLTTGLLARFPLAGLTALESHPLRRAASIRLGADVCLDPAAPDLSARLGAIPGQGGQADLVYELSGNPAALDTALALTRPSGRVVVGSWYGSKKVALDLGSFFHRGRLTLISSQVSSIAPALLGRWQTSRRLDVAWEMLRQIRPQACITHRFPLAEASLAYALIDRSPGETIQVIFEHQCADGL